MQTHTHSVRLYVLILNENLIDHVTFRKPTIAPNAISKRAVFHLEFDLNLSTDFPTPEQK